MKFLSSGSNCTIHHCHKKCCGTVQTTVLLGFISDYASSHKIYSATLPPDKGLGYRAVVDPFSVLGGRGYGNSLDHERLLCGGSRGSVQSVDHLSLSPSLSLRSYSHFFSDSFQSCCCSCCWSGFNAPVYISTPSFLGNIQWRGGSPADKDWPLISLAGPAPVPSVPLCPLYHLAEGDSGEMLHTSVYKGLCLKGVCVTGLIWILCPFLWSSALNTAFDIKDPFL